MKCMAAIIPKMWWFKPSQHAPFCKRCIAFLRNNSIRFRYVYVDFLNADVKQELKEFLAKEIQQKIVYPFLVVDDSKACVGFDEDKWEEILSL